MSKHLRMMWIYFGEQSRAAQQAIFNLEKALLEARRIHSAAEYRAMSEPILLEIQQREQEGVYFTKVERELKHRLGNQRMDDHVMPPQNRRAHIGVGPVKLFK